MSDKPKSMNPNSNGQARPNKNLPALPRELQQLEAAMGGLRPRDDRLNRDQLMFEAGRARGLAGVSKVQRRGARGEGSRGRGRSWLWPAAAVGMTAVAACLMVMLVLQGEPTVVERVKVVEVERSVPTIVYVEREEQDSPPPHDTEKPAAAGRWPSHGLAQQRAEHRPTGNRAPLVPRAGLDFRLFEHLMQQSTVPISLPNASPPAENQQRVLSPRSLPRLLEHSVTSTRRTVNAVRS